MTSIAPAWVIIDSISGTLAITTPEVDLDTDYYFYIDSTISGVTSKIQKLIKLSILNCTSSKCQKCSNTNSSTCEIWKSGYNLVSGSWSAPIQNSVVEVASKAAQTLSTVTTSVVAANVGVTVFTSLLSTVSIASLWMTINQLQLFFALYFPYIYLLLNYFNNSFIYMLLKQL